MSDSRGQGGVTAVKKAIIYPFARRFFAGETLGDVLVRVAQVNRMGMSATIDFLGEDVAGLADADAATAEYARAVESAFDLGQDASVAIKLTHIGLRVDKARSLANLDRLASLARSKGVFLWLDMEGSAYTDDTIAAYRRLLSDHFSVGIALQSALNRTWDDLRGLVSEGAVVRLVKGAYREGPDVAALDHATIARRYAGMLEYLFANARQFAAGTHDKALIARAEEHLKFYKGAFEFQMLMGMRDHVKRRLVADGHRVVEYVPYGTEWYNYGMRRIMEKRRNIVYFAQGLAGR